MREAEAEAWVAAQDFEPWQAPVVLRYITHDGLHPSEMAECAFCGGVVVRSATTGVATYCSRKCKDARYERKGRLEL